MYFIGEKHVVRDIEVPHFREIVDSEGQTVGVYSVETRTGSTPEGFVKLKGGELKLVSIEEVNLIKNVTVALRAAEKNSSWVLLFELLSPLLQEEKNLKFSPASGVSLSLVGRVSYELLFCGSRVDTPEMLNQAKGATKGHKLTPALEEALKRVEEGLRVPAPKKVHPQGGTRKGTKVPIPGNPRKKYVAPRTHD